MLIAAHVRSILLDYWDPNSIRNVPRAKGEYDAYIGQILRDVAAGASAERVARYLLRVETEVLHQGGDRDRALFVAEKLLSGDQMTMEVDPD
ncbi:hypothetical protein GCM10011321_16820 [Youhaiella tibetensis]|uniref:Uncharacterized protein n=1 Tax=Paradevosia tibetensis TaxID=1447062 RepID=A0A5B9DNE8_9HYPH|nr:hypothetical protein [Youhaiella tibetensis]QEE20229.1 hypothetical protein FNA67_08585 [Youhaiella tibetensis]GGF25982.1 hypothetical protein GCM10011321_16820 [Youhaiella tibetensis]